MFGLRILLLVLVVTSVSGWWWGRRRRSRSRTDIHHRHTTTTTCNCNTYLKYVMGRLQELEKKLGKRDVAEILDVDEDYPGLGDFVTHLDTKRDGTIDREAFASVIKRASSLSSSKTSNACNCGRAVLDNFNTRML